MKHLGFLRESHKVPAGKHAPKSSPSPPPIRTRPITVHHTSPAMPRIARAPNFPEIQEEDERAESPARRKSSSRLPVPTRRNSSPPPVEVEEPPTKQKKKSSRRQSGMVSPSQASDSPPPLEVPRTSPAEETDDGFPVFKEEDDAEVEVPKKKKKPKRRDREDENVLMVIEGSTLRLKDVTNSPQTRAFLPHLDTTVPASVSSEIFRLKFD